MAKKYTRDELIERLKKPGWGLVTGNQAMPLQGTLSQMVEKWLFDQYNLRRARGALPLQSAFIIALRIALNGAVSFHFVSPLLRSTPSCRHKASRSTGAGVDFILS